MQRSITVPRFITRASVRPLASIAAAALVAVGCQHPVVGSAGLAVALTAPPAPPVVEIMASDYTFVAPDTLPAGLTTVRMMNHGQEAHHGQLLRLNDGVTFDEFAGALQTEGDAALRLVTGDGGPGAVDPLRTSEVTVDLTPGAYVLACFLAGADGVPHLAKGMLKPLTVTPAPAQAVAAPEVNGTLTLRDFTFDLPGTVPAGKVTYKVVNAGPQSHELNVVKLAPGTTTQDILAWQTNPSTPPPFEAIGGMNGLDPTLDGYMTVDLQPGSYAAVCNIPDPSSGLPHSQLGMIKTFTVS